MVGAGRKDRRKFKSYYVVWKHIGISNNADSASQFKSYYVVWKPGSTARVASVLARLNRTM